MTYANRAFQPTELFFAVEDVDGLTGVYISTRDQSWSDNNELSDTQVELPKGYVWSGPSNWDTDEAIDEVVRTLIARGFTYSADGLPL